MSAYTTRTISRSTALERVKKISGYAVDRDWRALEQAGSEHGDSIEPHELLAYLQSFSFWRDQSDPEKYSNGQLETFMDLPYFRFYSLENYNVCEDDVAKERQKEECW